MKGSLKPVSALAKQQQKTKQTGTSAAWVGTTRSHSSPAPGPRAGPGTQRGCVGRSDTNSTAQADRTCSGL